MMRRSCSSRRFIRISLRRRARIRRSAEALYNAVALVLEETLLSGDCVLLVFVRCAIDEEMELLRVLVGCVGSAARDAQMRNRVLRISEQSWRGNRRKGERRNSRLANELTAPKRALVQGCVRDVPARVTGGKSRP